MAEYTREEALAFIDAMRLTIQGRTGFKWYAAKLTDLAAYIESVTAENERLKEYLDSVGARDDYESFHAEHDAPDRLGDLPTKG